MQINKASTIKHCWLNLSKKNLSSILVTNILILLFSSVFANKQLEISTHFLDFPASKKHQYFAIHNHGNETVTIKVIAKTVESKEFKIIDTSKDKFIIAPNKFTLKPDHRRKIHVVHKIQPQKHDQFFMVYVTNLTSQTQPAKPVKERVKS